MSFPIAPQPETTREYAASLGAALPTDHKAPATAAPVIPVVFRGHNLTLDMALWDLNAQLCFENNHIAKGFLAIFGEEQFGRVIGHLPLNELPELMAVVQASQEAKK
ncbi:hypothetical protein [Cryobacterium sp. SO1]|uniref:hypothetical protein n=1 Tax=Cryobacterium sp. SO1 TaxID=1897061 RepID=UPI00102396BD|nr:hypothetical protein [Cryobacterium sp. SO1]RZI35315.1 hypothetical protein BJQ95_02382 [Cryobacterium sp. SO1]